MVHGLDRAEPQTLAPQDLDALGPQLLDHAAHQGRLANSGLAVDHYRLRATLYSGAHDLQQRRALRRATRQSRGHPRKPHVIDCGPRATWLSAYSRCWDVRG